MRLDPVPLGVLAQHMADNDWLDMAVLDLGVLDRVKIETIHIHRAHEDLTVRQEWCDFSPENMQSTVYNFEQDRVRWCRCTEIVDIREVHPAEWRRPDRDFSSPEDIKMLFEATVAAAAFLLRVPKKHIIQRCGQGNRNSGGEAGHARDLAMCAMWEFSDLSQSKVARLFDNRGQASVSVSLRKRPDMTAMHSLLEERLGCGPKRSY